MSNLKMITGPQRQRLQVLYAQFAAHTQQETTREARLRWATAACGREIDSFNSLTTDEARHLIDSVQGQLNCRAPFKKRRTREEALRHGKDGRHDGAEFASTPEIASGTDLETIEWLYQRLGWTRDRFDAWLHSGRSPLRSSSPAIRTKAHANRVRWALKRMLKHAGLWEERGSA